MNEPTVLDLFKIVVDNSLNPRQGALDQLAVLEYSQHLDDLPAMEVYQTTDAYLLVAGFHRIAAHQLVGRSQGRFIIHQGSREQAAEYADLNNLIHGLNLTRAEKRDVIKRQVKRHPDWSDTRLAAACFTTDKTVRTVREELEALSEIPKFDVLTGADGIARPRSVPHPAPAQAAPSLPLKLDPNSEIQIDEAKGAPAVGDWASAQPAPGVPHGEYIDELRDDEGGDPYDDPNYSDPTDIPAPTTAPKAIPVITPLSSSTPAQPLIMTKFEPDVLVTIVIKPGGATLVSLGPVGQPPKAFQPASRETLCQVLEALLLAHYAPASQAAVVTNDDAPVGAPDWL